MRKFENGDLVVLRTTKHSDVFEIIGPDVVGGMWQTRKLMSPAPESSYNLVAESNLRKATEEELSTYIYDTTARLQNLKNTVRKAKLKAQIEVGDVVKVIEGSDDEYIVVRADELRYDQGKKAYRLRNRKTSHSMVYSYASDELTRVGKTTPTQTIASDVMVGDLVKEGETIQRVENKSVRIMLEFGGINRNLGKNDAVVIYK